MNGQAHGMAYTRTYKVWKSMVQRCTNSKDTRYHRYGGRGITVCDDWKDFRNFYRDMGDAPDGLEIDRIDNYKGYCKENCRWVTRKENLNNTKWSQELLKHLSSW